MRTVFVIVSLLALLVEGGEVRYGELEARCQQVTDVGPLQGTEFECTDGQWVWERSCKQDGTSCVPQRVFGEGVCAPMRNGYVPASSGPLDPAYSFWCPVEQIYSRTGDRPQYWFYCECNRTAFVPSLAFIDPQVLGTEAKEPNTLMSLWDITFNPRQARLRSERLRNMQLERNITEVNCAVPFLYRAINSSDKYTACRRFLDYGVNDAAERHRAKFFDAFVQRLQQDAGVDLRIDGWCPTELAPDGSMLKGGPCSTELRVLQDRSSPTPAPIMPTSFPSRAPSMPPTYFPSMAPTLPPSTQAPTPLPTKFPTLQPTQSLYQSIQGSVLVGLQDSIVSTRSLVINATAQAHIEKGLRCLLVGLMFDETLKRKMYPNTPPSAIAYDIDLKHRIEDRDGSELVPFVSVDSCVSLKEDGDPANIQVGNGPVKQFSSVCSVTFQLVTNSFLKAFKIVPTMPPTPPPSLPPSPRRLPTFSPTTLELPIQPSTPPSPVAANPISQSPTVSPPNGGDAFLPVSQSPTIQPTRAVSVLNVTHSPTIAPTHAALPTASPTAPPVNAIRVTALDYLRDLFFEKNSTMYTSAVPLVNQSMFLLHPDSIAFTWNWTFVGNYSNLTEVFEALYFDSVTTIPTRENEEFDNDLEKECPFVKELDPEFAAPTSSPTASDTDDVETPGASKTVVSVVIVSVVVFLVAMLAIWCVFDSKRKKRKRHRSVKKSQALLDGVPANDARVHSELIKKKTSASGFRILEPYAAGDISRGHLSRYSTDGSTESVNLTDGIQGLQIDIAQLVLGPVIGGGANGRIFKATYGGSDVAVKELVPNPGQYKKSFQRPLPPHSSSDAYNSGSSINSVSLPQSSKANGPPRFKPLSTPDRNLTSSSSSSSSGKVGGASTPVAGSTAVKDAVDDSSAVTPIKSLKPDFNISLKLSSDQSSDVGSSVTGSTNSVTPSRRPLKQHISSSNPSVASSTSSAVTSGYHSGTATQFSRSSSTESTPSGELSTLQKGQLLQRGVGVMASSSLAPHKSFRDKNVTDESSSTSEAQGYTGRNMPEWLEHETEDKSINNILNEVKNLRRLRHPNIIQLYGCTQAPSNDTGGWRFLVVMELAACSLLDLILKTPRSQNLAFREFTMDRKLSVAIQIAGGCKYIHDNSMIHFDIKPENILLNVAGNVKICDLGIARFAEGPISRDDGIPHGTPAYMAPEILHENQLLDNKVDVYSYGLVLWQILYGRQPHPRSWTVARLFFEVRKNKYRPPFDPAIKVDLRLIELVKLCWHELPQERPPFHKVISLLDVVILERGLSGKVVNKSVNFKIGDSVGLWDYNQKRYLPATVLDIDSDLSQADVQIKGNGDKHTGVPLVELIQQPMLGESTLASNPLHSITGLAFLHAGQNKHQAWNQPNKSPALGLKTNSSAALPAIAPMSLRFVDLDLGNVASESDGRVSGLSDDPFGSNNMNKTFHFDGNVLELPGFRLTEQGIEGGGSSNLLDELHYESGQLATVEENDLDNAEQDSEGSSFAVQPARQSDGSFGADTASSISCGSSSSSGSPRGKSSALAQVPIRDTLFRFAELGKGVSGTVSAAIHLPSFKLVAVKEVRFTDRGARHQAVRELVALYSKLRRVSGASDKPKPPPPHIVWLYTAYLDPDTQSVCLVMEHCDGGSLQDLLERLKSGGGSPLLTSIADKQQSTGSAKSDAERLWSRLRPHRSSDRSSSDKSRHRGSVDSQERIGGKPLVYSTGLLVEKTLSVIARSILTAIAYLHENRFLHLDIKPANILINSKGEVKLSDFGLAKQLEESGEQFASTFVGTMKYMSPERLRGEQYSYACDIFSFALTMLTVTLGHYPEELISLSKDGTTPNEMLSMSSGTLDSSGIVDAQQGSAVYWKLLERWKSGSPVQLPEQVLHRSMEEPSMLPVTESVTLSREYRDFLAKGLELDPAKRASAKELLNHPWIQMYRCETGFDNAEHISHTAESSRRVLQDIAFGLLGKVRGDNRVRQSFGCLGGQEEETGLALNLSERKLKVLSGELMLPFDVVKQSFIVAAKSNNISCT